MGIIGVLVLVNLGQFILWRRISARVRRLTRLLRVTDRGSLDEFIKASQAEMEDLRRQLDDLTTWRSKTDAVLARCLRTPAMVRYQALDGVGGDQSFSCALLDGKGDGVVLTGIYTRNSSYAYGKPVQGGHSTYALSAEEQEAVDRVLGAPEIAPVRPENPILRM
jgi:hypothetical protein